MTCDGDDAHVQGLFLQDVLYLRDDVLGTRALPVGGRVAPLPLHLQPAQLGVGQRQAHAALLPVRTTQRPQGTVTLLITMDYSYMQIK